MGRAQWSGESGYLDTTLGDCGGLTWHKSNPSFSVWFRGQDVWRGEASGARGSCHHHESPMKAEEVDLPWWTLLPRRKDWPRWEEGDKEEACSCWGWGDSVGGAGSSARGAPTILESVLSKNESQKHEHMFNCPASTCLGNHCSFLGDFPGASNQRRVSPHSQGWCETPHTMQSFPHNFSQGYQEKLSCNLHGHEKPRMGGVPFWHHTENSHLKIQAQTEKNREMIEEARASALITTLNP